MLRLKALKNEKLTADGSEFHVWCNDLISYNFFRMLLEHRGL